MAKVCCFTLDGIKVWFWSNDHNPAHFHAKKAGKWEVRVHFLELEQAEVFDVIWGGKHFSAKDKKLLFEKVESHRDELLREWGSKG